MSTYLCACCGLLYPISEFTKKCLRHNRNNHCNSCVNFCRYKDGRGAHHYYGVTNSLYEHCLVVRYSCSSGDCKNVTMTKGKICKSCVCSDSWCENKKAENSLYCLGHTCSMNKCSNHVVYNSNHCMNHTCKVRNCSEKVVPGFPHCGNHRCIDCSDSKCQSLKGSCPNANLCKHPGCRSQYLPDSRFCQVHKCRSCNNALATCREHTCNSKECIRVRIKGSRYCDGCTCVHPGCMQWTRSLHKYCFNHGCEFCRNEVNRFTEVLEVHVQNTFLSLSVILPDTLNKIIAEYISRNEDLDRLRSMRRIQMEKSNQCVEDIEREMNLYNRSNYVGLDITIHFMFNNDDRSRGGKSFAHCRKCANRLYCSGNIGVELWEDPVYCQGFNGSCGHIVAYRSKRCQCCTHRWLEEQGKKHKTYSGLAVVDRTMY